MRLFSAVLATAPVIFATLFESETQYELLEAEFLAAGGVGQSPHYVAPSELDLLKIPGAAVKAVTEIAIASTSASAQATDGSPAFVSVSAQASAGPEGTSENTESSNSPAVVDRPAGYSLVVVAATAAVAASASAFAAASAFASAGVVTSDGSGIGIEDARVAQLAVQNAVSALVIAGVTLPVLPNPNINPQTTRPQAVADLSNLEYLLASVAVTATGYPLSTIQIAESTVVEAMQYFMTATKTAAAGATTTIMLTMTTTMMPVATTATDAPFVNATTATIIDQPTLVPTAPFINSTITTITTAVGTTTGEPATFMMVDSNGNTVATITTVLPTDQAATTTETAAAAAATTTGESVTITMIDSNGNPVTTITTDVPTAEATGSGEAEASASAGSEVVSTLFDANGNPTATITLTDSFATATTDDGSAATASAGVSVGVVPGGGSGSNSTLPIYTPPAVPGGATSLSSSWHVTGLCAVLCLVSAILV